MEDSTTLAPAGKNSPRLKSGHVPIWKIQPSRENDRLYRPVDPKDPAIKTLALSIHEHGLLEPIAVSHDGYIISGHRRYVACLMANLKSVCIRVLDVDRLKERDKFIHLLREHNRQRDRTRAERLREELVTINPDDAHKALWEYRREQAAVDVEPIDAGRRRKKRAVVSKAKAPMVNAVNRVLAANRKHWPLSDRQIHYMLLTDPPLKHASKPDSRYDNTQASYKCLVELLTRLRLTGDIEMHAIADDTRPVSNWCVHDDVSQFERQEFSDLLRGYARNLMQSQPNHIEILVEKNTVRSIVKPIAAEYCIPLTSGRGYCSLPPRAAIADRFSKSGKEKLVLLIASDFDPDGDEIATSFVRSMRDDFEIKKLHAVRVALTAEQVEEFELQPVMTAKESSVHHAKFVKRHGGDDVYELEALSPADLQQVFRECIEAVIDRDAYSAEIEAEKQDAAHLEAIRRTMLEALKDAGFDDDPEAAK